MSNSKHTNFTRYRDTLFAEIIKVPEVLQQKYLPSLDGLRAISILIVIFSHIINVRLNYKNTIIDGGLGVQVFFVISGFLITSLLIKEKVKNKYISLPKFYIRRALRIFPVAYLFILVVFMLDKIFKLAIPDSDYYSAIFYFKNFVSHTWYLNHYWSLSIEEQFYLIFPFLLSSVKLKNYIIICFLLLLLGPVINLLAFHDYFYQKYFLILSNLFSYNSIVFGSLTAVLLFKFQFSFLKSKWCNNLLFCFLIVMSNLVHPLFAGEWIRLALISALIVKNISYGKDMFYRFLNLGFIKYIGLLSYSLYIWQQLFTSNMPWENAFPYGGSIILNFVLLFIIAYLSYNYFEKPFLNLKKRFSENRVLKTAS